VARSKGTLPASPGPVNRPLSASPASETISPTQEAERDRGPQLGSRPVLVDHRRRSLRVARGDRVEAGTVVAECGNSGNSTEPHVHVQAMDRSSVWVAAGLPLLIEGREPPSNGERWSAN